MGVNAFGRFLIDLRRTSNMRVRPAILFLHWNIFQQEAQESNWCVTTFNPPIYSTNYHCLLLCERLQCDSVTWYTRFAQDSIGKLLSTRVTKLLFLLVLGFFVCWIPVIIIGLLAHSSTVKLRDFALELYTVLALICLSGYQPLYIRGGKSRL